MTRPADLEVRVAADASQLAEKLERLNDAIHRAARVMAAVFDEIINGDRTQQFWMRQETVIRYHPALQRMTLKQRRRALTGRGISS